MDAHEEEAPLTPTMPSPRASEPPPTDPRGLPLAEPGVRDLVLAIRDNFEAWKRDDAAWKSTLDDRLSAIVGGVKIVEARTTVLESDFRQLRGDLSTAQAAADGARMRADTAHTMAETASVAAGRTAQEHEAEKESLLAVMVDTRGKLESTTAALTKTDEEIKAMVAQAAADSAGAAIREVVGKNPRLVAALGAVLLVLAQILSQRFASPPPAPPPAPVFLPAPAPPPAPKIRIVDQPPATEGVDL